MRSRICASGFYSRPASFRLGLTAAFLALLSTLAASSSAHAQAPLPAPQLLRFEPDFVPGEVLVRFGPGADAAERADIRRDQGATLEEKLPLSGLQLVEIDPDLTVAEAVAAFEREPDVRYAEPNFVRHLDATPNDTQYGDLWGLNNSGQTVNGTTGTADADTDAPEAWDHATGSASVQVAVIDSGVAYDHPDLAPNIWTNPGETGGGKETNGLDDDSNGRVDDWRGYDFVGAGDNDAFDSEGHGTHTAGTIGAAGNNGTGVAGVNWSVQLMPLRACGTFGTCTSADLVEAYTYAGAMGAEVANASLGGSISSTSESNAIAGAPNTLFVASAGNGGADGVGDDNDTTPQYPCNYSPSNIVCVAASNQSDNRASFSNFGASSVDLAAPGVNVLSTYPYQTVFSDNFETALAGRWVSGGEPGNSWERSTEVSVSPTHSLADSPGASYANNSDTTIRLVNGLDLTVGTSCDAEHRHTVLLSSGDTIRLEASENGATWVSRITNSGTGSGSSRSGVLTTGFSNLSSVLLRYRLQTDGSGTNDGGYFDDLKVRCRVSRYEFLNGTSMAAPHVSGAAALGFAAKPAATVAQMKSALLNVDTKASLSGVVASGGRLNAHKTLTALDTTAPDTSFLIAPNAFTNDNTPTFFFESDDPHATFQCRVDSDSFASCTVPHTTTTLSDGSHTFEVKATDEAGNTDATPASSTFTVDTQAPSAVASITDIDPDSPANDNHPNAKGTVGSGGSPTDVRVYYNGSCGGDPATEAETGTVAEFTGSGITLSIPDDTTRTLSAQAVDEARNGGPCSSPVTYVEDSTAPAAPSITDTDPDSPANDNNPEVKGSAEAGSTVKLYESGSCGGSVEAQGTAAEFATPGLTAAVADDQTAQFTATATDAAGNVSSCSTAFSYTENSAPVEAPAITDTDPDSPSNDNNPKVKGTVGSGSPTTIKLYKNGTCSGSPDVTGSVASFTGAGITVPVGSDATTTLSAKASNGANDSSCSGAFAYTEDSTTPPAPRISDTDPDSPANDSAPEVKGDAGGDGIQDIALGDQDGSAVSVFLGQAGAAFSGPTTYGIGSQTRSIAVADFNRDGDQDIAAAGLDNNEVVVLLGTAGGSFTVASTIGVGEDATAIATGDFNADGDPDLAVGGQTDHTYILLGAAGATFTGPTTYVSGHQPRGIAVADFNGDGDPDLATANSVGGNVTILLGAAGGTFTGPSTNFGPGNITVGSNPLGIASGDFNADGDPDLAVAVWSSQYVSILLGSTGGTFTGPTNIAMSDPTSVSAGDFNGDTDLDLAVTEPNDHVVSILLGAVGATFSGPTTFAATFAPQRSAVGDFNLDGDPDLAVTNPVDGELAVLLGSTGGTFGAPATYPAGNGSFAVAVGDFNGDGGQVEIYDNATCTGAPIGSGSAASFNGAAGITATVAEDQTTNLRATVTDAAGNTSACSTAFPYTEDSQAPAAPTITDTDPDSPANDNSPEVRGSVGAGSPSTIELYENGTCSGSPAATGTVAAFTGSGITVTVPGDTTTTLSARAVDAAGNESGCSSSFAYTEDSTAADPPTITDTDPDSPANDNNPEVKGSVGGGSPATIRLYKNGSCTGSPDATGTVAEFTGAGITTSVANDTTTTLSAQAVDAAGNASTCSGTFTYVEDSTAPDAPAITDTDPDSPSNENNPVVKGTVEAPGSIELFKNGNCSGSPYLVGSASSFATAGVTITVASDTTTTLSLRVTDQAGNVSPCSSSFTYTEDSTAPATPSITDTDPDSPANDNDPEVKGTADSGTTVKIYKSSDCSGGVAAQGTAAAFASPGLTVSVSGDQTTQLTATATDAAGNVSGCSSAFAYTEDSTAPNAPSITDTDPDPPANDNNPEVKGSAAAGSTVQLFADGVCDGSPDATGTAAAFGATGITLGVPGDATSTIVARAVDAAGNPSSCSSSFAYVEDSTAPDSPSITGTDPASPANDNGPEVKGTVGGGSPTQVKLYKNAICSGSPDATGTVAQFTGAGITVAVSDDTTTALSARAADAAGNDSGCSSSIDYVEDSTGPETPAITDTDPDSPANDNAPEVKGTVGGGSPTLVRIWKNGSCSGLPDASGTVSAFTGSGITVTVTGDATTSLSARAVDAVGNQSGCSSAFAYTEDSTNPGAPSITDTDPDSPSNDNNPEVKGTVETGATVELFKNLQCTGSPAVTGTAAAFTGSGITVSVTSDVTTTLYARAVDAAGNVSPCSDFFQYSEDSTAPPAPSITDTDPDSPANDNSPEVKGSADVGSTVKVYKSSDCGGAVAAQGASGQFVSPGLTVSVTDDQTTQLSATATDPAGNTSSCSASISYTEDSTAPGTPSITDTDPDSPANDNNPEVKGSAGSGSPAQVKLWKNGTCSGSPDATGTAADFTGTGITVAVSGDATTALTARSVDASGNESGCSASFSYTEDSTPPAIPTLTDTDPDSPSNDNNPKAIGSAEPGSTVSVYVNGCGGTAAQGTAAQLASPGIAVTVPSNQTSTLAARATDAAGNVSSDCGTIGYTEDSTAPEAPTLTGPSSPANDNTPKVKGTVGAGSPTQVKVYKNGTCSGSPEATGSVATFTGSGITVGVADDTTTTLSARTTDAAGNDSSCSDSLAYTEDSTAPAAPQVTDTDPDSPANQTNVAVKGSTGAGSPTHVKVYATASCSGSPAATGSVSDFTGQGIEVNVDDNSTTSLSARTTDAAGNDSSCSNTLAYTEDSTPPVPPSITGTSPSSPSNDNNPRIVGTAESGSTVTLYASSNCSGTAQDETSAGQLASPGLLVGVATDQTTQFSATARDAANNTSACSNAISYTEDSTAPQTTIDSGPSGTTDDSTPTFAFTSSEGGSSFRCRLDGAPLAACGSPHTTAALADGAHTFEVAATDAAGNEDASPASRSFTVATQTTPPPPPDSDGDGVPDATDGCPQQAATTPTGCPPPDPTPQATAGNDILTGDALANVICGLLGDDTIDGGGGDDTLFGDACNAVRRGIFASQTGTGGDDTLLGSDGNDTLYGAAGRDVLEGGRGKDKLFGGDGNDTLSGDDGRDTLDGGKGDDKLTGGKDVNRYKGGSGNDTISGRNRKKETVDCGSGRKDRATVDRADKVRGCERVKRART